MLQIINNPREYSVMIHTNYQLNTLFTKEYLKKLLYDGGKSEVLSFISNTILREISSMVLKDVCESEIEILLEVGKEESTCGK